MREKKLNDVFTPEAGGIFTYLQNHDVPWSEENIEDLLDAEYHYNIAGKRAIAPLLYSMLGDDETLTAEQRDTLASIIFSMYGLRWTKLWATMHFTYNPIENYDMIETMTDDVTEVEYGKTNTRTANLNTTNTHEVQGFNSNSYNPSDKDTTAETGTDTHTDSGSDTHTRNYTLERSGNIGVTTSQQMIESERALWSWQFFHDVVFPDINRVLTLSIY